jgi:phage tail sheath protein FI
MPVTPTYPGVYIEELPSSVRTITAVSTSVTAFVGFTVRGPLNTPVTVTSFADFERQFGRLAAGDVLGYSVQQFFLNGGSIAIVVRLAVGAGTATVALQGKGADAVQVTAKQAGVWGAGLRLAVTPGSASDGTTFGLTVKSPDGRDESYRDLSVVKADPRYAPAVVNPASALVDVAVLKDTDPVAPDPSGTVSKAYDGALPDLAGKQVTVTAGDDGAAHDLTLYDADTDGAAPATVAQWALLLERKLHAADPTDPAFAGAQVQASGNRLQVTSGVPEQKLRFTGASANDLDLEESAQPAQFALAGGSDGTAPGAADFIGNPDDKSGIYALLDVPDVNLLALPEVADLDVPEQVAVLAQAEALCQAKRAFLLVDPPAAWATLNDARGGLPAFDSLRSSYAALYFPRIQMFDPLTGQQRAFAPSGAVAGQMAKTDGQRGVWKAPAGTETRLAGVQATTVTLTDAENGLLNPLAVNCLRTFPIVGPVIWGARTLEGADALSSQWKYVPVRRLALMLEESLYRGTQWVVFEPNDERLWAQIRLNVGAFLQSLFRQGAFQGTSAREAYFVKCDPDTTTQDDINRGVVNILVGFAPLKPAEFVVVQIEQIAGQIEV